MHPFPCGGSRYAAHGWAGTRTHTSLLLGVGGSGESGEGPAGGRLWPPGLVELGERPRSGAALQPPRCMLCLSFASWPMASGARQIPLYPITCLLFDPAPARPVLFSPTPLLPPPIRRLPLWVSLFCWPFSSGWCEIVLISLVLKKGAKSVSGFRWWIDFD
jgi:hypothetical protein